MQKQDTERASKIRKPFRYRLYLKVRTLAGKKRMETFVSKATDRDFALAEIRTVFKHFAYYHKWETAFSLIKIVKLK